MILKTICIVLINFLRHQICIFTAICDEHSHILIVPTTVKFKMFLKVLNIYILLIVDICVLGAVSALIFQHILHC